MKSIRNKLWRTEKGKQKYIRRLKYLAAHSHAWLIDGVTVRNVLWIDLYNKKCATIYKTTSTPCSCPLCRGERYDRVKEKRLNFDYTKTDISMNKISALANKWADMLDSDESLAMEYVLRNIRCNGHLDVPEARQLTEFGIPILHALATELGCDAEFAYDAIEDGEISYENVMDALQMEYERMICGE